MRYPFLFLFLLGLSLAAAAQSSRHGGGGGGRGPAGLPNELKEDLNLDPDALARLEAAFSAYRREARALRREGDREKMQSLRQTHLAEAKNLLSEAQYRTYQEYLEQRRGGPRGQGDERMAQRREKWGLTADQSKKMDATLKAYQTMVSRLRDQFRGDRAAFAEALEPVRAKRDRMLRSFLTAEQFARYETEAASGHHH